MKIDFSRPITERATGEQAVLVPEHTRSGRIVPAIMATLGLVCADAMSQFRPDRISGVENIRRGKLIARIIDGGEVELTADEVGQIVDSVGQHPSSLVAAQCVEMLDPEQWARA